MKKSLILPVILLIFVSSIFAQTTSKEKKYEFKGVIKNQDSAVIGGANLYFKNAEQKFTVVTDINGEFKTKLVTGDYEITVNDVLSKTFKAFMKIRDEGANPNNVSFIVKTNKNLCGLADNETCPTPISLPKPIYPAAARATNTSGEVVIKIKIDENGEVISATKISGHPLLVSSALSASKQLSFDTSDNLLDKEIEVTYVYVLPDIDEKNLNSYSTPFRFVKVGEQLTVDYSSY